MLILDSDTLIATNSDTVTTFFLYEVTFQDGTAPKRYTNWSEDVQFEGHTFEAAAIKHGGITQSNDGKIHDVTFTVGNADRIIQYYLENYELYGKPVRLVQFFDGQVGYINMTYAIKSAAAKDDSVTFSLSIGIDILKTEIPGRIIRANYCGWRFKDTDCQYAGAVADCDLTIEDCAAKNNVNADGSLRFGGFPGVMNERFYF